MNRRNIAVDIGNTRIKSGEFDRIELVEVRFWETLEDLYAHYHLGGFNWGFGSVRKLGDSIHKIFADQTIHLCSTQDPLPVSLDYKTPETLGIDRVLGTIGARLQVPDRPILVVDLGTCLTFDLLDEQDRFLGGVISPGFKMRLKAMHVFTDALPDISDGWAKYMTEGVGKSTKECLVKGARDGMALEINGFISERQKEFPNLAVILTGGDAPNFESMIKEAIFADQNLVLKGINKLLNTNK